MGVIGSSTSLRVLLASVVRESTQSLQPKLGIHLHTLSSVPSGTCEKVNGLDFAKR